MQTLENTRSFEQHKIQQLAHAFFNDRSDKNFNALHKEITKIVNSVAPPIVKYDEDKLCSIISDISLTVWNGKNANDEDIYNPNQSFLSWVFVSARNKAIQHFKKTKTRKEVYETDMTRDGKDDEFNSFDNVIYTVGHYDEINDIDVIAENEQFHNNPSSQVEWVKKRLAEMYDGEEYEILYKAMIEQISPKTIADEHGVGSRITVSTRNTRVKKKIAKELSEKINTSKMSDDLSLNGSFVHKVGECAIKCERKSGVLWGEYKKFFPNGNLKIEGQYADNKKVGEWKSYYENGNLESIINYSNDALPFVLYDRYGCEENIGQLN